MNTITTNVSAIPCIYLEISDRKKNINDITSTPFEKIAIPFAASAPQPVKTTAAIKIKYALVRIELFILHLLNT